MTTREDAVRDFEDGVLALPGIAPWPDTGRTARSARGQRPREEDSAGACTPETTEMVD